MKIQDKIATISTAMKEKGENSNPIKLRIYAFLECRGMKKGDFCQVIGMSIKNFHGDNVHSDLASEKVTQILISYPELSPDWLLLGQGPMLRSAPERPLLPTGGHDVDALLENVHQYQADDKVCEPTHDPRKSDNQDNLMALDNPAYNEKILKLTEQLVEAHRETKEAYKKIAELEAKEVKRLRIDKQECAK